MNKTLYLLRGVSGAGKTTLASTLVCSLDCAVAYAADDYFYDEDGVYNFDQSKLSLAHQQCINKVSREMWFGFDNIIVHNTFTTEKEMKPYLDLAEKYEYKIVSLIVENRHNNSSVHNVPKEVLDKQEERLKKNIKLK